MRRKHPLASLCFANLCWLSCLLLATSASAEQRLGDFCRIKGQEENILHGMGLVVGLKGTGDGDSKTTQRALGRYMELMGHRLGADPKNPGQTMLDELKGAKNVALVVVTSVVPAGGAQQGDLLDCTISAVSAKSLDGGYLLLTELKGPLPADKTVYGLARGMVSIDDSTKGPVARVVRGCQLEASFQNQFVKNGKLMLVMDKDHAAFATTSYLAGEINRQKDSLDSAEPIDQTQIEVTIPQIYIERPAVFAANLLETRMLLPAFDTKVVINERKKAIIIGKDVEVAMVAVTHKNRLIQAGAEQVSQFVVVDPTPESNSTKLSSLVTALNALKVPTEDVIDIIKMLKHKRALYGELIIE
jgi:flagellar P-ring protein precursor FlgI